MDQDSRGVLVPMTEFQPHPYSLPVNYERSHPDESKSTQNCVQWAHFKTPNTSHFLIQE
jgi:hypothetical protein